MFEFGCFICFADVVVLGVAVLVVCALLLISICGFWVFVGFGFYDLLLLVVALFDSCGFGFD